MKQLFKKEELIGKTIEQIIEPSGRYEDLWIKFNDGSFVKFNLEDLSTGFNGPEYVTKIDESDVDKTESELVELGLLSKEERDDNIKSEEERHDRWLEDYERERNKELVKYELGLLNKLKDKYKH